MSLTTAFTSSGSVRTSCFLMNFRRFSITQIAHDTPGRVYYLRKQAEGKTRMESLRALKRRISDAVYRQLLADTSR